MHGSTEERAFARDLSAAYEEYGFVIIQNHGIDKRLIDQCLRLLSPRSSPCRTPKSAATRCRAAAARAAIRLSASKPPRARSTTISRSSGTSAASCRRAIRSRRTWRLTSGWTEFPGFRESTLVSVRVLRRARPPPARAHRAHSVHCRANYFDDKVNLGNSVLRIIHYPPMPPEPTPSVRAGAHEDINVITLLLGAEEPGLEVLSTQGRVAADQSAARLAGVQRRRHAAAAHQQAPALDHAPRREPAARAREQRALLAAFLPALQSRTSSSRRCRNTSTRSIRINFPNRSARTISCRNACARSSSSSSIQQQ